MIAMLESKKIKLALKAIAITLVLAFVAQDVVWANPEIFRRNATTGTLQIPLMTGTLRADEVRDSINVKLQQVVRSMSLAGLREDNPRFVIEVRGIRLIVNFRAGAEGILIADCETQTNPPARYQFTYDKKDFVSPEPTKDGATDAPSHTRGRMLRRFKEPVIISKSNENFDQRRRSYLNRHREQCKWIYDNVMPYLIKRAQSRAAASSRPRIAVLSMGASTGEELARIFYELAHALKMSGNDPTAWKLPIDGFDIEPNVVSEGRKRLRGEEPFAGVLRSPEKLLGQDGYSHEVVSMLNRYRSQVNDCLHLHRRDAMECGLIKADFSNADLIIVNHIMRDLSDKNRINFARELSKLWPDAIIAIGDTKAIGAEWEKQMEYHVVISIDSLAGDDRYYFALPLDYIENMELMQDGLKGNTPIVSPEPTKDGATDMAAEEPKSIPEVDTRLLKGPENADSAKIDLEIRAAISSETLPAKDIRIAPKGPSRVPNAASSGMSLIGRLLSKLRIVVMVLLFLVFPQLIKAVEPITGGTGANETVNKVIDSGSIGSKPDASLRLHPEYAIDFTPQQIKVFARGKNGEKIEFTRGFLYHGRDGLDEILLTGEILGESYFTRVPQTWAISPFVKSSKDPAIFIINALTFDKLVNKGSAVLEGDFFETAGITQFDPYPKITHDFSLKIVLGIWTDEDTWVRYQKILNTPDSELDERNQRLKPIIKDLIAKKKLVAFRGLHHIQMPDAPFNIKTFEIVERHFNNQKLYNHMPKFRVKGDIPWWLFAALPLAVTGGTVIMKKILKPKPMTRQQRRAKERQRAKEARGRENRFWRLPQKIGDGSRANIKPVAGSLAGVFGYLSDNNITNGAAALTGERIAKELHRNFDDTISRDISALDYLGLIRRHEDDKEKTGKDARWFVPESVKKKLQNPQVKSALLQVLSEFKGKTLRPSRAVLDTYLPRINEILKPTSYPSADTAFDSVLPAGKLKEWEEQGNFQKIKRKYRKNKYDDEQAPLKNVGAKRKPDILGVFISELDGKIIIPGTGVYLPSAFLTAITADTIGNDLSGQKCLDLGTGTGVLGLIMLKRRAVSVVFTDIKPQAIGCAKDNTIRLGYDAGNVPQLEFIRSDLFSGLSGRKFNLVLFTPSPIDGWDISINGGYRYRYRKHAYLFFKDVGKHLDSSARIIFRHTVLSDDPKSADNSHKIEKIVRAFAEREGCSIEKKGPFKRFVKSFSWHKKGIGAPLYIPEKTYIYIITKGNSRDGPKSATPPANVAQDKGDLSPKVPSPEAAVPEPAATAGQGDGKEKNKSDPISSVPLMVDEDDIPDVKLQGWEGNIRFLRTPSGRLMGRKREKQEYIEINPENGIKCIKEKDPNTGKYRHKAYIYPEGQYKINSVEFKYDRNGKVRKIDTSWNKDLNLKDIVPFKVTRNFTFTTLSDSQRSSSECEWAIVQMEEGGDIDKVLKFSLRYFDNKGCFKEEKFYTLGLEATVEENLLSFAGLYASKFNFATAIACELLEGIFKAVHSGRTLKEGIPESSFLCALGEIQRLRKVDQEIHRDLRELRWVAEHRDKDAEVKAEEKYIDTLSFLSSLVTVTFRNACNDKQYIHDFLRAVKTVSNDWAANVLLDPRELHLTLPKIEKAQMLVIREITSSIKQELWKGRGRRARYDKFLLRYLFFWALEGDADFIIKLIRNIDGDSRFLINIKLKGGRIQESWENILYLYASIALMTGVFDNDFLSDESLGFLVSKLDEFLKETKDKDTTKDDSLLREAGDKVQNIIGMLVDARDIRLYEHLIAIIGHPLEQYMSENYPNLPVDFIAGGLGGIYPLLKEEEEDRRNKIIEILISRLNHKNVWRALAAAEELAKIRKPACAKALLESYEGLRARLPEGDVLILNRIYTGLRNHKVLPITLSIISDEEVPEGVAKDDILLREEDIRDRIKKVTQENLSILRFIKEEITRTLPDKLIEELADSFLYPDGKFKTENRNRIIELLQKFAYTESGYDEYETIYFLYKIRPFASRIRADLFIERFPEVSSVVNEAHVLIGPIFLELFGINRLNRPIIPESYFHSQIIHMKQHMGSKDRPGLSQLADKVKNFGTNWPVLLAVASRMLLRGNIKDIVYNHGEKVLDDFERSAINYQPFVTLNVPDLVRKAFDEVVSGLGESEKTKLGSHLLNELNYSLSDFRKKPELFNIYADEITAILAEFPFSDRSRIDNVISRLAFLRRQGIEFRYIHRGYEDFRLGDLVGDCTEIGGTNFWSVPTFLAHPFYQTLLVYYNGQLVDKVDFTLIGKGGEVYLVIDAHEPVPQLDEHTQSASQTLIDKREEIFLATIDKIREIAHAINAAGIRAVGTSNRKYIEGVYKILIDKDTGEEKKIECIKPGLYKKFFGDKKDQQKMVRLLGGMDVIQRFAESLEESDAPILAPLLAFKEGKPRILFQTARSLTGKEKILQLFGRVIERHLSIIKAKSKELPFSYPYKELNEAISELDFQKATDLIFKNDDRLYRDLREFVEQQADEIYAELGKLPGALEEKTRRALELTFEPSGVEGYSELYEIPFEPTGGWISNYEQGVEAARNNREEILRQELGNSKNRATTPNGKGWAWTLHSKPRHLDETGSYVYRVEYRREDDGQIAMTKYVHIPFNNMPLENAEGMLQRFGSNFVNTTVVHDLVYYDNVGEGEFHAPIAYVQDELYPVLNVEHQENGTRWITSGLLFNLFDCRDPAYNPERGKAIIINYLDKVEEMWKLGLDSSDNSLMNYALELRDGTVGRFFDLAQYETVQSVTLIDRLDQLLERNVGQSCDISRAILCFAPTELKDYFRREVNRRITELSTKDETWNTKSGSPVQPSGDDILEEYVRKRMSVVNTHAEQQNTDTEQGCSPKAASASGTGLDPETTLPIEFLRNIVNPEELTQNMIEGILSALFSNKRPTLAFSKKLKGLESAQLRSLIRQLKAWKESTAQKNPKMKKLLDGFTVLEYDDLKIALDEKGIDPNNAANLIFTYGPRPEDDSDNRVIGPAIRPVYIVEPEGGFPAHYYYPLLEMVTVSLAKELLQWDESRLKEALAASNINTDTFGIDTTMDEKLGILIFRVLPKMERYDNNSRINRYTRLIQFLRSA